MQPATIKLFLINGSPTGLRTAEISNWTGKAIAGPRSDLDDYLKRPELATPGVYFLSGVDADSGEPILYIGEAENVAKRLKQHAKTEQKDYWVHTSAFVSKDDNLTKAHIKYIEGKLIQQAHASKRVIVMNSASSGSSLPEADRAEMDVFIERMIQLLPVLGIHHFSKPAITNPSVKKTVQPDSPDTERTILYCKVKGLIASGTRSEDGFTVFKDSQAVEDIVKSCPAGTVKLRKALVEKGIISLQDGSYIFTEDYEFSSPSAAGAFISGRSTNGLTAWVTEDNRPLKDLKS
ncbi:GIY-YIG nuclease family protein [Endozoicomonas lisbonensis]|uniref:GIY-YIG domain-containing protein n=1 Tax=Endozoicomonas lisbonensis TaxID=3120522 RepID=A0ABV2SCC6_9GAMM